MLGLCFHLGYSWELRVGYVTKTRAEDARYATAFSETPNLNETSAIIL